MEICIPSARKIEEEFLTLIEAPNTLCTFAKHYRPSLVSSEITDDDFNVALLTRGELSLISSLSEFRFLTSLIGVILLAGYGFNSKSQKPFQDYKDRYVPSGSRGLVLSLKGRECWETRDLYNLAANAEDPDVFYLSGIIFNRLYFFFNCYPISGYGGAFKFIRDLEDSFSWMANREAFILTRNPQIVVNRFKEGLRNMKDFGMDFKFRDECFYLLDLLNKGSTLVKVKASTIFA